ncbi:MAG: hypothetical protein JWQ28_1503 [Pedobacter sp.]|jgi:hypothetical protein|nr:hypothetical protein [Pedobacter sp.]
MFLISNANKGSDTIIQMFRDKKRAALEGGPRTNQIAQLPENRVKGYDHSDNN